MLVEEIMTSPAVTVRADASVEAATRLLAERRLTMLPVVDAGSRLVGVVSEADLLGLPEPSDPRAHLRPTRPAAVEEGSTTVAELMVRTPHTTSEHADVAEVAALFHRTAWKVTSGAALGAGQYRSHGDRSGGPRGARGGQDGDRRWVGSASKAGHVRRGGHCDRRVSTRSGRSGRPGVFSTMVSHRPRRVGRSGGGGLHGLAFRG
jgi:CBS domain-containing protein